MLRHGGRVLYSASDLVNFMGCAHATFLDVGHLASPTTKFAPNADSAVLLQERGIEHERAYLEPLRAKGRSIAEIAATATLPERAERTRAAMRGGYDVIYQGAFLDGAWHGYSDFLLRVENVPSDLGEYAYDVADTKLSRSAKPKHLFQLCIYAGLLAREQGCHRRACTWCSATARPPRYGRTRSFITLLSRGAASRRTRQRLPRRRAETRADTAPFAGGATPATKFGKRATI